MSKDDFIRWVYGLVCTHYEVVRKDHPVRRGGGFTPKLTNAEVITLERGGELSHTICVGLNLQPPLSPLEIADLMSG